MAVSEYHPVSPIIASFEKDEIHHHSFLLGGVKYKNLVLFSRYEPNFSYFIGHLSDRRLIIEPWKMPGGVALAVNAVGKLAAGQLDSATLQHLTKSMLSEAKASNERAKFLAESKVHWSIPYSDIASYETEKVWYVKDAFIRVNIKSSSDKDAFIFTVDKAASLTRRALIGSLEAISKQPNKDFRDLGNNLLMQHRNMLKLQ